MNQAVNTGSSGLPARVSFAPLGRSNGSGVCPGCRDWGQRGRGTSRRRLVPSPSLAPVLSGGPRILTTMASS